MRDFYDIRMLLDTYEDKVNKAVLKDAFAATCKKRGTDHLQEQAEEIIKLLKQMNSFKCCGEHIRRNTRMQQKLIMPV